ncbi:MAG: hypothetical protein AB4426_20185 [Xenococcaceae cyanobacterium]
MVTKYYKVPRCLLILAFEVFPSWAIAILTMRSPTDTSLRDRYTIVLPNKSINCPAFAI